MRQKISVIIPTARRGDLLRQCLESLKQQTISDFETILVSDGAGVWAAELAKEFGCTLVNSPRKGFAAAVNAGVAKSQALYVAVVNDDVRLCADWLRATSSLLDERADVSFCCGKIYLAGVTEGMRGARLDNAGDAVSLGGSAWRIGHGRTDSGEFDSPRPVLAVPGTAALFRKNVFEGLGGLDEDFIAYLEDVDFALRAARQGHYGLYLPQATSIHWGGATSGGTESPAVFRLLTQNQLAILAKTFPLQLRLAPRVAWAQLLWAAMAVRKHMLGAWLAGVGQFLRLLPKMLGKRQPWRAGEVREFMARLRDSEREIHADTCARDRESGGGFWRMYFSFFPPERRADSEKEIEHAQG